MEPFNFSFSLGSKSLTSNTTTLNTVNDEIAHLTCTSRGHPVSSIKWEKEGKELGDQSPGVVVISCNNGTIMESHLLVAVTEDERRGTYTCVVLSKDGETRRAFVIQGGEAKGEKHSVTQRLKMSAIHAMLRLIRFRFILTPNRTDQVQHHAILPYHYVMIPYIPPQATSDHTYHITPSQY